MNDSDDILINEAILQRNRLKNLIRTMFGKSTGQRKGDIHSVQPKQLDLPISKSSLSQRERPKRKRSSPAEKQLTLPFRKPALHRPVETEKEPKLEKPKIVSTLFSKKMDMSSPPFYTDADKWYKENFKREDDLGYTYSLRYIGPTLDKYSFVFGKYPHDNDIKSFNSFYEDREKNMNLWNELAKNKLKKKYPDEFEGMNEELENKSMKLSEIKEVIEELVSEVMLKSDELEGPYTVYVKKGRLSGQTVMAKKRKSDGVYYYLNPDTGHDEALGKEDSVDVQQKKIGEVNHTKDSSGKTIIAQGAPGSVVRFATEHPDVIKGMREWAKDCQWREISDESEIDELPDEDILRGVQNHYDGGIKAFIRDFNSQAEVPIGYKNEGVGYVYAKDRKKDPKSIPGEHWRIKFQSSSDLKKHGNTEKSKVNENLGERCKCGKQLKYVADIGAPGTGQSWECPSCKSSYVKLGSQFIDTKDVDQTEAPPWELDPSDVMESISKNELKNVIGELINEMWSGERLQEVTMPQSKPTPNNPNDLWKLIDQMEIGQAISFYNPKNPSSNTTAPWIHIKKTHTGGHDGIEISYNIDVELRMDSRTKTAVLVGADSLRSEDEVTEDEVSLALEVVAKNINILSMYYIETEEAPPKQKGQYDDSDHALGDYEKNGPDEKRPQDGYVEEDMEVLREIIRESIKEVQSESK